MRIFTTNDKNHRSHLSWMSEEGRNEKCCSCTIITVSSYDGCGLASGNRALSWDVAEPGPLYRDIYWATFFVSKLSRSKLIKPRKLSTFLETLGLSCPHSTLNVHLDDKHCITIMVLLRDHGYLNQFVRCNKALSTTLLSAYWSQPGATFQEGHFLSSYLHLLLSTIPSFLYLGPGASFLTYFIIYLHGFIVVYI